MLGVADVKPVAEHDTDKSDASEIVPVTQPESDYKHSPSLSMLSFRVTLEKIWHIQWLLV